MPCFRLSVRHTSSRADTVAERESDKQYYARRQREQSAVHDACSVSRMLC